MGELGGGQENFQRDENLSFEDGRDSGTSERSSDKPPKEAHLHCLPHSELGSQPSGVVGGECVVVS